MSALRFYSRSISLSLSGAHKLAITKQCVYVQLGPTVGARVDFAIGLLLGAMPPKAADAPPQPPAWAGPIIAAPYQPVVATRVDFRGGP